MDRRLIVWIKYKGRTLGACYYKSNFCCNTIYCLENLKIMLNNYNKRLSTMDNSSKEFVFRFFMATDKYGNDCKFVPGLSEKSFKFMKDEYGLELETSSSEIDGIIYLTDEEMDHIVGTAYSEIKIDFGTKTINLNIFSYHDIDDFSEAPSLDEVNYDFNNLDFIDFDEVYYYIKNSPKPMFYNIPNPGLIFGIYYNNS